MSRIDSGSSGGVFVAFFLLLALIMSTCNHLAAASSSRIAWNVALPSDHHHNLDSISGLLLARAGSESKTLVKAKQILQDLTSSTTCFYAPTVRLLQQCKNVKPKHENAQSEYQLGNAESAYAISMALCEAMQARVTTPSACRVFERLIELPLTDPSIEIVRPQEIEACSAVLYGTPGWTSYSTYKANAKFLCESSRTDYQREELLQTLRDATNVIPEILDVLNDHRNEANVAMSQLYQSAASVQSTQQEILIHAQEQGKVHSARLEQLVQYVEALQGTMAVAVSENSKALDLSTEKASAVDQKLTEFYASFVEAATGLTFDLNQQIVLLSQQTTSMLNQIHDLGTQANLDHLQATLSAVSQTAVELARLQAAQMVTGQEVLQAFNEFSPDQLLPKWLTGFSTTLIDSIEVLKFESTFFIIFAAPSFVFLLFGQVRLASCIMTTYSFSRSLWSYVPGRVEILTSSLYSIKLRPISAESLCLLFFIGLAIRFRNFGWHNHAAHTVACYLICRPISKLLQAHKHEVLAFLLHRRTYSAGLCLLTAFTICFCAITAFKVVNPIHIQQGHIVDKVHDKRPRRDIKEAFERSRRACSVPLDCEYA